MQVIYASPLTENNTNLYSEVYHLQHNNCMATICSQLCHCIVHTTITHQVYFILICIHKTGSKINSYSKLKKQQKFNYKNLTKYYKLLQNLQNCSL